MSAAWAGGSTRSWRRLRLFVLDRDGYACQIPDQVTGEPCGAFATHVDHVLPLSKGGEKYDDRNCRAACASCNLRRGAAVKRQPVRAWSW